MRIGPRTHEFAPFIVMVYILFFTFRLDLRVPAVYLVLCLALYYSMYEDESAEFFRYVFANVVAVLPLFVAHAIVSHKLVR